MNKRTTFQNTISKQNNPGMRSPSSYTLHAIASIVTSLLLIPVLEKWPSYCANT